MKRTLKIIAWTIVAVVAVGMLLALAAGFFAPGIIRDFVVKKTGFGLSYDKFTVNLFTGSVKIDNLKLTNPSSFATKDFVAIDKAVVSIDLFSLASPTIHLREATLHLSSFDIVRNSEGVLNTTLFANAFQNKKPSTKPQTTTDEKAFSRQKELCIDKLSLALGKLRSTDETRIPARTSTNNVNFSVERTNIRSRAELQTDLTAALLPVLLENAGIKITPLTKVTGSTLGVAQKGVSLTTESVDAVAEKAASRLKNFIRKHE